MRKTGSSSHRLGRRAPRRAAPRRGRRRRCGARRAGLSSRQGRVHQAGARQSMSAVLKDAPRLAAMREQDLDEVMEIENAIYSHPWTRGNFSRLAARRLRLPRLAPRRRAPGLLHPDGGGGRGASAQPVDRRAATSAAATAALCCARRRELARRRGARSLFLEVRPSNGAAQALYCALRLPQASRAARLLSGAPRARGRAGVDGAALMSRREAILAEMGLAPVWRLKKRPTV